ncbi:MAG: hypothetical protein AABY53_06005 [Bdellovibrionota bacterium]
MRTFILLALTLSFTAQAQTQTGLTCSQNGTLVTFTNGVDTSRKDASQIHLEKVKRLLPNSDIDKKGNVEYSLTYNFSAGLALDLYESQVQKTAEFFGISFIQAARLYSGLFTLPVVPIPEPLSLSAQIAMRLIIAAFNYKIEANYQETIDMHLSAWKDAFRDNKKIIAISHSQGGLFINDAYTQLMAEQPINKRSLFAMLQVATPASSIVASDKNGKPMGSYLTNAEDFILSVPGRLNANIPLTEALKTEILAVDKRAHGFSEVYIKFFTVLLKQDLKNVALLLGPNCCQMLDGTPDSLTTFINPDGSEGGLVGSFVSTGPYQDVDTYIGKDVIICGSVGLAGSQIFGNVKIFGDYLYHTGLLNLSTQTYGSGYILITNRFSVLTPSSLVAFDGGSIEISNGVTLYDYDIYGGRVRLSNVNLLFNGTITGDTTLTNTQLNYCNVNNGVISDEPGCIVTPLPPISP